MKNRRSVINYSINRSLQFRILGKVMLIALVNVAVIGALFYVYADREIAGSYRQFHIQARNFLDYLLPAVALVGVVGLVTALGLFLFLPHAIAGPLYRIERILRDVVGEGDLTVRFGGRKGDLIGEFDDVLNVMVEKLRAKVGPAKKAAEDLEGLLGQSTEADLNPEQRRKLAEKVKDLSEAMQKFRL